MRPCLLCLLVALLTCLPRPAAAVASAAARQPFVTVSTASRSETEPALFNTLCENAPMEEVLTDLFQATHVHFLIRPDVKGSVTVNLQAVRLETTLRVILSSVDPRPDYEVRGGVYVIQMPTPRTPWSPQWSPPPAPEPQEGTPLQRPQFVPIRSSSWADIRWGATEPSGLQMGLWKKTGEWELRCLIRNHGPKPLRYNDYFLGYWETLKVWARPHGTVEFCRVPLLNRGFMGYKSAGPGDHNHHDLAPGQVLLGKGLFPAQPNPFQASSPLTPTDQERNYTFVVSLGNYDWPPAKDGLDIKITQLWPQDDPKEWLDSGVITLPVEAIPPPKLSR